MKEERTQRRAHRNKIKGGKPLLGSTERMEENRIEQNSIPCEASMRSHAFMGDAGMSSVTMLKIWPTPLCIRMSPINRTHKNWELA